MRLADSWIVLALVVGGVVLLALGKEVGLLLVCFACFALVVWMFS